MPIDYNKPSGSPAGSGPVSLTKASPTVSLTKQESGSGIVRVNLNWNARPQGSGGLFRKAPEIDLDLGCLYSYTDGSKGVVQALGNAFRDRNTFGAEPLCRLDGDDRSGSNSAGENLFIDLRDMAHIERIVVFAYIYEGVASWDKADGIVTIHPATGRSIEVRLDDHSQSATMCAIALIDNDGGVANIRREVRYVAGHRALDEAFGWGLNWTQGRK